MVVATAVWAPPDRPLMWVTPGLMAPHFSRESVTPGINLQGWQLGKQHDFMMTHNCVGATRQAVDVGDDTGCDSPTSA